MILGRILGWLLAAAALVVVGRDLMNYWYQGAWSFVATGELWTQLHPESLLLLQPAVQRHVFAFYPQIWDQLFIPLLELPAAGLLGVLAVILLVVFRRRRRPHGAFR